MEYVESTVEVGGWPRKDTLGPEWSLENRHTGRHHGPWKIHFSSPNGMRGCVLYLMAEFISLCCEGRCCCSYSCETEPLWDLLDIIIVIMYSAA